MQIIIYLALLLCVTVDTSISEKRILDKRSRDVSYQFESSQAEDECQNNSLNKNCDNRPADVAIEYLVDKKQSQRDDKIAFVSDVLNLDHCSYCNNTDLAADGQETTLRQVLLIHRHGDRTPINFPPKDKLNNESFWRFHGPGQLTNRGKARLYIMGQLTRKRYEKFLNRSVNKNMRMSRSSGGLRCIESAQVFLSALLPLDAQDSPDSQALVWNSGCDKIGSLWQPASIQTMPIPMDGMLAESAVCGALMDEYMKVIDRSEEVRAINQKYEHEAKVLEEVLGFQVDSFYKWFWASSQIEVERSYFGDKVDKRILDVYDRIQEAGRLALVAYQSTIKSRRLRAGLLISDMIENMKNHRKQTTSPNSADDSKKFIHYSSHDLNVLALVGILDNIDRFPFRPDYASNVILELHQDGSEWFVKFFYMPHVPSKLFQIHIDECEREHPNKRCTLDMFEKVMQPYVIKQWSSWMKECGNDMSSIDPYAPSH